MSVPNPIIPSIPMRGAVNKTSELLPCPFCGGPAKMIHPMGHWVSKEIGYGPDGSRLACSEIGCTGVGSACYGPDQDAEAIAAWNRRAIPAPEPQPEVAAEPVAWDWDIEKTADAIAKSLAAIKDGRIHGDIYNAAKAGALEALKCASAAITTLPAVAAEPVEWQSRARQRMEDHVGEWSEWRDGKAPQPIPPYWEVEERPLATPPVVEEAVKAEPWGWHCEHGDGRINLVLWPDARDRYEELGFVTTALYPARSATP